MGKTWEPKTLMPVGIVWIRYKRYCSVSIKAVLCFDPNLTLETEDYRRISMKKCITSICALALFTFGGVGHASQHKDADWKANSPEVVERSPQGKVTKVRVDGKIYEVCESEEQDSCIQPRAAGLGRGDIPLSYWPGERK